MADLSFCGIEGHGRVLQCSVCPTFVVLPHGPMCDVILLEPAADWYFDTVLGWRCPEHTPKLRAL
jgi:hypothetical protein